MVNGLVKLRNSLLHAAGQLSEAVECGEVYDGVVRLVWPVFPNCAKRRYLTK